MKKLINDPLNVVDEMLDGFVAAHSDIVRRVAPRVVSRAEATPAKVALVIGGGSGHEPAFAGYVGRGLADAAALGGIFTAPPPSVCLTAITVADQGHGALLIYGNYAGDRLNFGAAEREAREGGRTVETVRVTDDVASAPASNATDRRGIAGDVFVFKAAGAAAERGDSFDDVARIARKANAATRSMGVGLTPCEIPGVGRPSFDVRDTDMEVGLGIHGEPGIETRRLGSADETAHLLLDRILADEHPGHDEDVAVLVNGLGATSRIDLYVLYQSVRSLLGARGRRVAYSLVGEFVTSLEMGGASLTVMSLDEELRQLLVAPARAVAFVQ